MKNRTAALLLTTCLPALVAATGPAAQEVVYVVPAARPQPVARVEAPEAAPRLTDPTFRNRQGERELHGRRGLWKREARDDLYAREEPGQRGTASEGETEDDDSTLSHRDRTERAGLIGSEGRSSSAEPRTDEARARRILYSHRVREGGVVDPYARLEPDGRSAPLGAVRTTTRAQNPPATTTNLPAEGENPAAPALNADAPPRPGEATPTLRTGQRASDAETLTALNSSAGAAGTSNSLFVDGALITVEERSRLEWESLGIRSGSFILRPSAALETEVTDNASLTETNRKSDVLGILRAGFSADSDWTRHALSASVDAEIGRYTRETDENYLTINAAVLGRLDVRERTSLDTELRYSLSRESRAALSSGASAARRPFISSYHASARGNHRFNRLTLSLRGAFEYADYGNSWLIGGIGKSNDDRDFADISTSLRATYDVKPGLSVYAEGGVSLRRHRIPVDSGGLRRNSDGVSGLVGARFELGRLVRADASLGVVHRNYRDATLKDVTALTASGQLAWNISELTTLYGEVSTSVNETDLAGASASVERQAAFGVQHELLRNVIIGGELRGAHVKAIGSATRETAFSASLTGEYRINRNAALNATLARNQRFSNQAGGDYVENTARLGLNLRL